jgi:hypothetical protein
MAMTFNFAVCRVDRLDRTVSGGAQGCGRHGQSCKTAGEKGLGGILRSSGRIACQLTHNALITEGDSTRR